MSEFSKSSLKLAIVASDVASRYLDRHHPLGSGHGFSFAIGVWFNGLLSGVMTFGNPISNLAVHRYKISQRECLELRKMHVLDVLPKNSESRCLAIAAKLVFRQYPRIKLLLTYCDESEGATAYKASGWIACEAHRYVRDVLIDGRWLTVRNANRLGVTKKATETRMESRRKWILPRDESVRQLVIAANSAGASNKPKRPLTDDRNSSGCGSDKTHANSRAGSTSQHAAVESS